MAERPAPGPTAARELDAVVIGAGFAGLYMNHRLRDRLGLSTQVYEAGDDVGGTWYWNRYPGARCDSESYMYCFSFDKDLMQEWEWSGKYPEQPEILRYLNHVADRFDLRRNIQFNTRVTAARWDDAAGRWLVETDQGDHVSARFVVTAIGCLSSGQIPDIPGRDSFGGEAYHTGAWPHDGVDLTGKRVGVIGTGSSGVQSIPVIAKQAAQLYVFQRTPQYTIPARHGTVDKAFLDNVKRDYEAIYEKARWSNGGLPFDPIERSALSVSDEERRAIYEEAWQEGGFKFLFGSFFDIALDRRANDTASEFIRSKIREIVTDPDVAERLVPVDHPFTSKRALIDTDYFDTYNRDNVTLVDIRHAPIQEITPTGIRTADADYELDVIVFATGFDAMTGSYNRIDVTGCGGQKLKDKWAAGPRTYLGVASAGFPNLFMITGPGSPSVLSNMPVSIEQHVEWISDAIERLDAQGLSVIDADEQAEAAWVEHVNELASHTMFMLADSWYLGANIPGKPRVFMPYPGGVGAYRKKCNEVAEAGYAGFTRSEAGAALTSPGA
ncbi:MAG: flavin-containing monooxygenase [Acidimicrobiales bacterium]